MKVFIVYAHPSEDSFTRHIRDRFIAGLESVGHSYILSDLYRMNFRGDMDEGEYLREAYYRLDAPIPDDVRLEHEKINNSDAIVFIYPVFWSDVPAKLKGWFDRVWTYGFAYGLQNDSNPPLGRPPGRPLGRAMKQLEKGLVICSAGNTMDYFRRTGILESMERTMLNDRLFDRVKTKEMVILEATSRELPSRKENWDANLGRVFRLGSEIGKGFEDS
ncbi:MAG: NAD(P)H-dependent oxidoreductase [Treponema sp.]|jgi:NAD(P)H dehydrogenase (quinone)|nr:NAD(P)H-dependent oxidoreductase [Treponema sp.]